VEPVLQQNVGKVVNFAGVAKPEPQIVILGILIGLPISTDGANSVHSERHGRMT
jgi:hypothetical protein